MHWPARHAHAGRWAAAAAVILLHAGHRRQRLATLPLVRLRACTARHQKTKDRQQCGDLKGGALMHTASQLCVQLAETAGDAQAYLPYGAPTADGPPCAGRHACPADQGWDLQATDVNIKWAQHAAWWSPVCNHLAHKNSAACSRFGDGLLRELGRSSPDGRRPLCQRSSPPKPPPPRGPRPPMGGPGGPGMFSRDNCLKVSVSMPLGTSAAPAAAQV